jgi:LPS-assembly protein
MPTVSTTPPTAKPAGNPVIIDADEQDYHGSIANANGNVVVHSNGDTVYGDHVIYDRSTQVVIANGNVRIFSNGRVYRGDSITYNLETKAMESSAFFGDEYPKLLSAKHVTTPGINHYRLTSAAFTTSNREAPSFSLRASTIEYRPNDEVVLKNVLLYIDDIPVFYFPIFVQSLTDSRPVYQFEVGTGGQFGAFIENKYNWVANNQMRGTLEFDAREKRGYAGGLDVQYFPTNVSEIVLNTYFAHDNLYSKPNPTVPNDPAHGDLANSNVYDGVPDENRYRIEYQHHLQFTDDLYSIADINVWSDPWITRDYFQGEYQSENQPPNFVDLDQYNPNFNVSLLVAPQANPFFETVERLPELLFESKQQKIFGSQIEYTGQSSVVNFEQRFADTDNFLYPSEYIYRSNPNQETAYAFYHPNATYGYNTAQTGDYGAYRYDTYHELSYPHQYFNFLSLTPRIGGRFTYYSDDNDIENDQVKNPQARLAGNVGLAGDFKISRTWTERHSARHRALLRFGLRAFAHRHSQQHSRVRQRDLQHPAPAPRPDPDQFHRLDRSPGRRADGPLEQNPDQTRRRQL